MLTASPALSTAAYCGSPRRPGDVNGEILPFVAIASLPTSKDHFYVALNLYMASHHSSSLRIMAVLWEPLLLLIFSVLQCHIRLSTMIDAAEFMAD